MGSSQSESARGGQVEDKDKAELMAYAGKPFLEMAKLARENGLGEREIQEVLGLGDNAMAKVEEHVDYWNNQLGNALRHVANYLNKSDSSTDRELLRSTIDTERFSASSNATDNEAYALAKERLLKFVGIGEDQEWRRKEGDHGRYARFADSPLGFTVGEYHPSPRFEILSIETPSQSQQTAA